MTTKNSPIPVLQRQADEIAKTLKKAERGERIDARLAGKVQAARESKSVLKVGVIMDDKTIILDLPWDDIAGSTEAELSAFILKLMQETRDDH